MRPDPEVGMKKEILRLEHLNYSTQNRHLLKDLSLNVYEHEIFGILGLADAGKTLLADYLTEKRSIDSGRIFYNDIKINNCVNLNGKGLGITHITNDTKLISELTIAKNFYIAIKDSSRITYTKRKAVTFAQSCLNDLNISISAEKKAGSLNKCHQHIIAMCIAYHCHSKLIIVDDAMAGYSPQDIIEFQKFLNNLCRHNIAIMIMTHSIEYATMLSDRIAILKNGRNIKVIEKGYFDKNVISKILLGTSLSSFEYRKKAAKQPAHSTVSIYSVDHKEFVFEARKGSVVGIFDPDNILCDSLDVMKYETLKNPVVYTADGNSKKLYSIEQALRCRTAIIFEDYFTTMIYKNVDLKNNIGLLSFEKLSSGVFGYISKRREAVFLRDSEYYSENSDRNRFGFGMKNSIDRQKILLERLKMFNPELILCVKALSHLDPVLINMTFSSFHMMAECGAAVIVMSNDYSAFSRQFNRVSVVRNGRVEATLSQDELLNTDYVAKYLIAASEVSPKS